MLKLKGTLHMMMSLMLISTNCQEMVPQEPTKGFVFCMTMTSLYPGKMFLGGNAWLVSPHSVFVSTSRRVNMDQLLRLRMHLTPDPPPPSTPALIVTRLVLFRDSPGLTRYDWVKLQLRNIKEFSSLLWNSQNRVQKLYDLFFVLDWKGKINYY